MAIPTYTPGEPPDGASLGITKVPIRNNFTALAETEAVDHIALNSTDQGKHKFLRFPSSVVQGASPGTAANEVAFYTKLSPLNAPQLFFQNQNIAAAGIDIQMTNKVIAPVFNANGAGSVTIYSFVPGNMLLITGFTGAIVDQDTITLSTNLTAVVSIQLSPFGDSPNGTNRALIVNPTNPLVNAPASFKINLRDSNNNAITTGRTIYFCVLGLPA